MSQVNDERRGSSAARGYGYRWQKARATFLTSHPLCVMHQQLGQYVPATLVDHIDPHRGDQTKFWNKANWQSLCKACHDGAKKRLEMTGRLVGCTDDGIPVDPNHHWTKARAAKGEGGLKVETFATLDRHVYPCAKPRNG